MGQWLAYFYSIRHADKRIVNNNNASVLRQEHLATRIDTIQSVFPPFPLIFLFLIHYSYLYYNFSKGNKEIYK